jgi:hypothetical protein
MTKDELHLQRVFPLGTVKKSRPLMNATRGAMEEILDHRHQHCPNCGGLTPEIVFTYKGYEYVFTCTKIRKKGKVIAGTDYKKLHAFCEAEIRKPKKRRTESKLKCLSQKATANKLR